MKLKTCTFSAARMLLPLALVLAGQVFAVAGEAFFLVGFDDSLNIVGYVNHNVPPGYTMLARHLHGANDTVGELGPGSFSAPANGHTVFTMDASGFKANNYFNGWTDPNTPLRPGDGWFLKNPYSTNVFLTVVGEVTEGTNSLPSGFSTCSSILPRADLFSFPAVDGNAIYVFNGTNNTYASYAFSSGWPPGMPPIQVGQSFWLAKNAGAEWIQDDPDVGGGFQATQPQLVSTVGQLNFFTFNATNAGLGRVYDPAGLTPLSSQYLGQLYAGTNLAQDSFIPLGTPVSFLDGSGAGYIRSGTVSIPFAIGGQVVHVQLRAWRQADGATYEMAALNSGSIGKSAVVPLIAHATTEAGLPGIPPPDVNTFPSFSLGAALPLVIVPPQSQSAAAGASATFSVLAGGQTPLHYQWQFNGTNLGGATQTNYTRSNIQPNDAGGYRVVVTNALGAVTSAVAVLTVVSAPSFNSQPQSQIVAVGSNVAFSVAVVGTPPLTYQWRFFGTNLPNGTNATLGRTNAQIADSGPYFVIVTNGFGAATSAVATLTVLVPPAILTQPRGYTNGPGNDVTFSVTASGTEPLIYQWRLNGAAIGGATQSSHTRFNTQLGDSGGYSVVVSNGLGSVTSLVATLLIVAPPVAGDLDASFPRDLFSALDKPVSCVIVQTNGKVLVGGGFHSVGGVTRNGIARINADGTLDTGFQNGMSGIGGPGNLPAVFSMALQPDGKIVIGGLFSSVNGVGRFGVARLNTDGSLDTGFQNGMNGIPPAYVVYSVAIQTNGKVVLGGNFTTVNAVARTNLARLNTDGSLDGGFLSGLAGPDATVSSVVIQSDGRIVIGGYFSKVNNDSTKRHLVRLNANGSLDGSLTSTLFSFISFGFVLSTVVQTNGQILVGGEFQTADGLLRNRIARLRDDGAVDTGFQNGMTGLNTFLYSIAQQTDSKVLIGGPFTNVNGVARGGVARLNADGSLDTSFQNGMVGIRSIISPPAFVRSIAVQADGNVLIGGQFESVNGIACTNLARLWGASPMPSILSQPQSLTVLAGQNAAFSVTATTNPVSGFQWRFGGVDIPGATAATYIRTNALAADAGLYTVVVSNAFGAVASSAAVLIVNVPPSITTPPQSQAVSPGTDVTFTVLAAGTAPLSYQWKFNGATIPGATANNYVRTNAQFLDGGGYSVVVTNNFGSVTSAVASLTLLGSPPSILTPPQSQTVNPGSNVTFTVAATGDLPFSYQWLFNEAGIAGATATSYTRTNAQSAQAGNYSVVVTNFYGSVTSAVAVLTVSVPPSITTQPLGRTVSPGSNVLFTVAATGTQPLSYQWRFGGINIPGANANNYTRLNVQTSDSGNYSVVVTNVAGARTSVVAVLFVNPPGEVIARWNFNSAPSDTNQSTGTTLPSTGNGTAALVGSPTALFTSGDAVSDPASADDNSSWFTRDYPAQGTGNKTAGVEFRVSTIGRENISVSWSELIGFVAGKYFRLQYSSNGTDFVDYPTVTVMSAGAVFQPKAISLAGLPSLANNSNFAFRIVAEFESTAIGNTNANYVTVNGSGYTVFSPTWYDMVTVYGTPMPLNPRPILSAPIVTTNGQFRLTVMGEPGSNYVIEASTTLLPGSWTPLSTNVSPFTFIDTSLVLHPARFYRALLWP